MTGILIIYSGKELESRIQKLGDILMEATRETKDQPKIAVRIERHNFESSGLMTEFENWYAAKKNENSKKEEPKSKA